ncbi:GTP-binding protein (nucleomorph) [Cryptomonas paramecium]|uniref:GTP-binding protein n=1 Tax=Cryptomonas paramaecium TaxID=2898 RepID=F2HH88_9CRYP|nr:GTP-binding protein [Cryptomonas paramecium]AEA38684.1 GTP-binding protein [Cryptomonas paramecium]
MVHLPKKTFEKAIFSLKSSKYFFKISKYEKKYFLNSNVLIKSLKKKLNNFKKNEVNENFKKNKNLDSKRSKILFKIIYSSELICWILDIRNPIGTWNSFIIDKILLLKKKFILILNKIDLVPSWITSKWLKIFHKKNTVIPFCSTHVQFGKTALLKNIKHIKKKNFPRRHMTIGVLGYEKVGKTKLISSMKEKKSSKKILTENRPKRKIIKLLKNVFMTDSPGIKYALNSKQDLFELKADKHEKNVELNLHSVLIKKFIGFEKKNYFRKLNNFGFFRDMLNGSIPWYSPIPSCKKRLKKNTIPWIFTQLSLSSSVGRATDS